IPPLEKGAFYIPPLEKGAFYIPPLEKGAFYIPPLEKGDTGGFSDGNELGKSHVGWAQPTKTTTPPMMVGKAHPTLLCPLWLSL
ncbi:MAG: hypothetical protein AB1487_05390, partial [Thermodesulfobacteriota bacterium]